MPVNAHQIFRCYLLSSRARAKPTLLLGLVGEHWAKGHVSDTFHALCARVELVVDDDASSLVELHADRLEVESLGHRPPSDRDEDDIRVKLRSGQTAFEDEDDSARLTVSSLPPFAASTLSLTVSPSRSAPRTLVLSLILIPCFCRIFWNCLLRILSLASLPLPEP